LRGVGGVTEDGNIRLLPDDSPEVAVVRQIFPPILRAARQEVHCLMQACETRLIESDADEDRSELACLEQAKVQLNSWRDDGYLVIDVNTPNAFVSSLVPRLVFVHRGLFRLHRTTDGDIDVGDVVVISGTSKPLSCTGVSGSRVQVRMSDGTDTVVPREDVRLVETREGVVQTSEQLAMLLGHELSHVIHGHALTKTSLLATAAGCNLVLLAILDPTGLLSFCFDAVALLTTRFGLHLPMSRHSELEADATGLRICARAGFDPRIAPEFFDRMLALEAEGGGQGQVASWASTHPRTEERAEALRGAADQAIELYEAAVAWRTAEEAATGGALERWSRVRRRL